MPLQPCPYRQVNDDGLMLCRKIKAGDRAITSDDCLVCPIAQVDCSHLRATLVHAGHPPLLVRYGNGRTEVWQDPTPPLALERAACAALVLPLDSSSACADCARRVALALPNVELQTARAAAVRRPVAPAGQTLAPTSGHVASVMASASLEPRRAGAAGGRIIQLEAWRAARAIASVTTAPARAECLPPGREAKRD